MARVTINLDQIAIAGARRAPAYMHFGRGLLFAQVKVKSGRFVSYPLGTSNEVIAAARMVPLIEKLIKSGELELTRVSAGSTCLAAARAAGVRCRV